MNQNSIPIFYSNFLKNIPVLTRQEEINLSHDALNGTKKKSEKAINKLIESNIKLAIKIAMKDFGWFHEKEDLVSEAILGLRRAAEKYNSKFGAKFSTYASYFIRDRILRYINRSSLIPMSDGINLIHQKIQNIIKELSNKLGREPKLSEISDATGMDEDRIESILNFKFSYVNLDSPFKENDGEKTLSDIIEDTNAVAPDKIAEASSEIEELEGYLQDLKERELFVIKKRFGFDGEEPMILEDIGKILNVTRERIRQIQDIALKKIRKNAEKKNLFLKKSIDDVKLKCNNRSCSIKNKPTKQLYDNSRT